MFKLDNEFLTSLGLGGLPVDEKNKLLQMIYERLEMNVGMRLAEKMTEQQLDEFEAFIDQNDEAGALKWLETNFPNYKDVVAEELEKLKVEVTQAAPQILASQTGGAQPAIMTEPEMPGVPEPQPVVTAQQSVAPAFQAPQPSYQQPAQPTYAQPAPVPQSQPGLPTESHASPAYAPQQPAFTAPAEPTQPYVPSAPAPVAPAPQTPAFDPTYNSYQPTTPAPRPEPQLQPTAPSFGPAPMQPQPAAPASTQPQGFSASAPSPQPAPSFQPLEPNQPQQFTPPTGGFTPPPSDFTPGQ